jgi:hypothetical protein
VSSTYDRTINIPVTVKNGAVIFPDDFDHKVLKKDFQAELILEETNFTDKNFFHSLAKQKIIELLPVDSRLLVNIAFKDQLSADLDKFIVTDGVPKGIDGGFVEIILRQPQGLKLRGKKNALLLPSRVEIPALPVTSEQPAASINHACTLISQAFEPWRISHTVNVFFKVYARDDSAGEWLPLDAWRKQAVAKEMRRNTKTPPPEDLFEGQSL